MPYHLRYYLIPLLIIICLLSGCVKSEISEVPKGALVVDVRTSKEFEDWHYPGSVNIPVKQIDGRIEEFGDKNRLIIVYCRSGNRSSTAKKKLIKSGFTHVLNGGSKRHMKKLVPLPQG